MNSALVQKHLLSMEDAAGPGDLLKELISGKVGSCFPGAGQANNPSSQKFTVGLFCNMWLLMGG